MIGGDCHNMIFTDLHGCQRFDGMDCQIQLLLCLFVEQAKATQIPPKGSGLPVSVFVGMRKNAICGAPTTPKPGLLESKWDRSM